MLIVSYYDLDKDIQTIRCNTVINSHQWLYLYNDGSNDIVKQIPLVMLDRIESR